jgi:enoyl-CoA hydratase/carnithine racemase
LQSADAINSLADRPPAVHFELLVEGTVGVITLDDARRGNAMTAEMGDAFTLAVRKAQRDDGVRAVLIRGAGANFSTGADREMLAKLGGDGYTEPEVRNFILGFYNRWLPVLDVSVPVISVLHGECFEAAIVFACVADIVVADETLTLRSGFTRAGLYPGIAIPELLRRKLGAARTSLLLLAEESISGREAERIGLVERCVPAGAAFTEALRIAKDIAAAAPGTIRALKQNRRLLLSDISAELELDAMQQARDVRADEYRHRAGAHPQRSTRT